MAAKEVSNTRLAPMDAAEADRMPVGGNDMGTSGTTTGQRKRTPAEGLMASDVPTQYMRKKCRAGDLDVVFIADKEVAKEYAQWWHSDMTSKFDTLPRKDPRAPFVVYEGGIGVICVGC